METALPCSQHCYTTESATNVLVDQFGRKTEIGDVREITEDGKMEGAVDAVQVVEEQRGTDCAEALPRVSSP